MIAVVWLLAAALPVLPALAADWEREVGAEFPGGMRSLWVLERVAQVGGDWVFTVAFTNGSSSPRTLQLRGGDGAAVLLVAGSPPVNATDTGNAASKQVLASRATARAELRFPAPAEIPSGTPVTLRTRWVITQDMAADRFVDMEMPFTLP